MHRIFQSFVATLVIVVAALVTVPVSHANGDISNPRSASSAKDLVKDFDFVDLPGKTRKFSEFRGKVVLIDFWATWCGPCLADMPKLRKIYDKYNAQGFEILGMNAETIGDEDPADPDFAKESAERAKQIVSTKGAIWTHANAETALPLAVDMFNVKALPAKILVDRDGGVLARLTEKDDAEKMIAAAMAAK